MLVLAFKPGHDGSAAILKDGRLLVSLESEKDSFVRHSVLTPTTLLAATEYADEVPDVVAIGGWMKAHSLGNPLIGAGYVGAHALQHRPMNFLGRSTTLFSSSHDRSHIMMGIGMAPRDEAPVRAVLVWEGTTGSFYLVDDRHVVVREIRVLQAPGLRFAFLFALADPTFPDQKVLPRLEDSGKLMALAAYGDPEDADEGVKETIDRLLTTESLLVSPPKAQFRSSPLYNAGVESDMTKIAAALLTRRIFEMFAAAAQEHLPRDIPLHISGGCGLNCDWNLWWRELGHFSSVFVPPCTNDAGSAIGTAIDALATLTGEPYIEWDVYSGLEFESDCDLNPDRWERRSLDKRAVADVIAGGQVVAWVQGRWEIGPRALGNRSLLAEPFDPRTRDRLNEIKQRESYRPVAPVCRVEDLGELFHEDFEDPYMLYFRRVRSDRLGAVTHVDGSARCQTVSGANNEMLHGLLTAFADRCGAGILCNTSLNFKGFGFINRLSDLAKYCDSRGVDHMVVGDSWFSRADAAITA